MIQEGELMDMLSQERADDYYMWMDVGWTLFNIGNGMDEAFELWNSFSQRSAKYEEGVCESAWNNMEMKGKTIASLLFMAKSDSPDDYSAWKNDSIGTLVESALMSAKPNENDIAAIFNKLYGENYICVNSKKGLWYEFSDHRWHEMDDCIPVRTILRTRIRDLFMDERRSIRKHIADAEDRLAHTQKGTEENITAKAELATYSLVKKRCDDLIHVLGTKRFHDNVLGMLMTYIHNKKFIDIKDNNTRLMCFENGVLDLENCTFREGRPDDYCTLTTGKNFNVYGDDDEEMEELDDYLGKVYVNRNLREYFIDFMASCLEGGNRHKRFLIAAGKANGAKSMTLNLLEEAFGSGELGYFGRFPRELMTQSTGSVSSSNARPELVRSGKRRLMATQELGKRERLNVGFLKQITGNDPFYARGMYSSGGEIKPQFTTIIAVNDVPPIPADAEAMWDRTRILPHESVFVKPQNIYKDPVPESEEEQYKQKKFKADPQMNLILPDMAEPLMYKLFKRYKRQRLTGESPIEPPEVMYATEVEQTSNDIFKRFINDCITKVADKDDAKAKFIKLAEVEDEFKTWHAYTYPSFKYTTGRQDLKKEITKNLGTIKSKKHIYGFGKHKRWWGYKFTEDADETVSPTA
ncbi:MAG: PriCT-2 domain-containing protein, partial [Candidatus Marinimicrobia bacterium]|nr:PriCT-2 domain-containing protein [Candidatus Neomarinimicrobiota bacterium]